MELTKYLFVINQHYSKIQSKMFAHIQYVLQKKYFDGIKYDSYFFKNIILHLFKGGINKMIYFIEAYDKNFGFMEKTDCYLQNI